MLFFALSNINNSFHKIYFSMENPNLKSEHVLLCEGDKITSVHPDEIIRCVANNGWVDVYTTLRKNPFLILETFEQCEEEMKQHKGFRIGKSVISILPYVKEINLKTSELTMDDGSVHLIAKEKLNECVYAWMLTHKKTRGRLPIGIRRLIEEKEKGVNCKEVIGDQ
jgi:hypothetical protein